MPIYLVRWPDLTASLVRADDEDELLDILDQVANSEGCEWSIYEGPLFVDFRLPVEWNVRKGHREQPISTEQIVVESTGSLADGVLQSIETSISDSDDGWEMGTEIVRRAFPELQAVVDEFHASANVSDIDGTLPEAKLLAAVHAELARVVCSSWRHAQLRNRRDPASDLARQMDLPVALAQRYVDAARQTGGVADETDADTVEPAWLSDVSDQPLFVVSNHHTTTCGKPPTVDADASQAYQGYFTNEHGEQSIYTYDGTRGEATVRMGETGWQNIYRVVDGRIEGINLTQAEATWLRACWMATGGLDRWPPSRDGDRADGAVH